MGAAGFDYEAMAKRISLKAGGLSFHLTAGATADGRDNWQKMIFQVKSLYRNVEEAVKIVRDIIAAGDLSHRERGYDLIAEKKNNLHASVVPSGHVFARRAAATGLSLSAHRDEQWHGRTQLRFICRIAEESKAGNWKIEEKLRALRNMVFRREGLTLNMTADVEGLDILSEAAEMFAGQLGGELHEEEAAATPVLSPVNQGIAIPAQVSYVAKAFPAPAYADTLAASLFVAAKLLANDYLYQRIRVQGGAYGGMCQYEPLSGIFAFLSYRDPHIMRTLQIYGDAPGFLRDLNAAGLAFIVAGSRWGQADGQVMFIFLLSMAAAEVAVGLALILLLYSRRKDLDSDAFGVGGTQVRDEPHKLARGGNA